MRVLGLMLQVINDVTTAHINVAGPFSNPAHLLFQEIYEGLREITDEYAERLKLLQPETTVSMFSDSDTLPAAWEDIPTVQWVFDKLTELYNLIHIYIQEYGNSNDFVSQDILIEANRKISHYLYLLKQMAPVSIA